MWIRFPVVREEVDEFAVERVQLPCHDLDIEETFWVSHPCVRVVEVENVTLNGNAEEVLRVVEQGLLLVGVFLPVRLPRVTDPRADDDAGDGVYAACLVVHASLLSQKPP